MSFRCVCCAQRKANFQPYMDIVCRIEYELNYIFINLQNLSTYGQKKQYTHYIGMEPPEYFYYIELTRLVLIWLSVNIFLWSTDKMMKFHGNIFFLGILFEYVSQVNRQLNFMGSVVLCVAKLIDDSMTIMC